MRKLFIIENFSDLARRTADSMIAQLGDGFEVSRDDPSGADMVLVFGGDGAFLHGLESWGFPEAPILGINTGHLGFFQELLPEDMDLFKQFCSGEGFTLQPYRLLKAQISSSKGEKEVLAINDFTVRDKGAKVARLSVTIEDKLVERFFGDGFIVASCAGSTAYSYSLGGAIVDPRLESIQLTPMAPINSKALRSFTSSMMFPPTSSITIAPMEDSFDLGVYADGMEVDAGHITGMKFSLSEKRIHVVRKQDYEFWAKVESKFL
ncbi:MAG: NAD(+)/NADH kinase [Firmicutes bacterium]|nr:NAD(+)/NADH kinase [Bacillota bacterium]